MAGSTNLQQFNPTVANQETDAQYTADSQRTSGFQAGQVCPSILVNKVFYDLTTVAYALTTALAEKGFTCNTLDVSQLIATFSDLVTTADSRGGSPLAVGYASTIQFNATANVGFELTLTGNVSSSTLVDARPGDEIYFVIHQDSTGNRTFSFPSLCLNPGTISGTASSCSYQAFRVRNDGNLVASSPMLVTA